MDLFIKGGPIMYFILVCSIIAVSIFIDKIVSFHKSHIDRKEFMSGLKNELRSKRLTEAGSICMQTPGPIAGILKAGIMHSEQGIPVVKEAMEKVSVQEISRMERGVPLLATFAILPTLLGLLGTVLGLMNVFGKMAVQSGMLTNTQLSAGIWEAMLTTAFGLTVAIPTYLAYNYLVGKIKDIIVDMEESAAEFTEFLAEEEALSQ